MKNSMKTTLYDQASDLLEEYDNSFELMENLLDSFQSIQDTIEAELEALNNDFDDLRENLKTIYDHLWQLQVSPELSEPLPFHESDSEPLPFRESDMEKSNRRETESTKCKKDR